MKNNKLKLIFFSVLIIVLLICTSFILNYFFVSENQKYYNSDKNFKLGYCPTMQEEAEKLAEKNNYELIGFDSASEVLYALKNDRIDKALIGRKAKLAELSLNNKETILKSGYTLVSNEKGFIDFSALPSIEIYTALEKNFNFSIKRISLGEVLEKINNGKIVLIPWEDWNDNFELVVVINGTEKVKDFRGVFLYEQ